MEVEYEVNPTIVRGLDYYNHTVFEIKADINGNSLAIGGGGRYNGLVKELGGPETPAIGFASGFDRLVMALKEEKIDLPIKDYLDCFIMYVNEDEKKYAMYLAQEIRMAGFICDTEYTNRSLKAQFKQADRLKSKFLIILNSDDLNNGQVMIRNNVTKEENLIEIEYLIYYLDEQLTDDVSLDYDMECSGECGDDGHCLECHNHKH